VKRFDNDARVAFVSCNVLARTKSALLVEVKGLPQYAINPTFLVDEGVVQKGSSLIVDVIGEAKGIKDACLVDVPGEALNFGRRLVIPTTRLEFKQAEQLFEGLATVN
jgi:hypothetical protein